MKTIIFSLILVFSSFASFALDYGIDRLSSQEAKKILSQKNLAVLTHAAAKDKHGTHLIDLLFQQFKLKKIFAPEHGLRTLEDDWGEDGVDEATGLPVISLYKRNSKAPSPKDLQGIDAIVIDLQDVGVRYYTYFSTIAEVMKVASPLKIEVIILDRPNLLGGKVIEGKVLDQNLSGHFISYHTIPTRHGMTLGELSHMINIENKMNVKLRVMTANGWKRERILEGHERSWTPPSPALTDPEQVSLYAIWGLAENFNLSVGRGKKNDQAFRVIGAPWITKKESLYLAEKLNGLSLTGLFFSPHNWKVTRAIYEGKEVFGVKVSWSGDEVRTDEATFKIASTLMKIFSQKITLRRSAPHAFGSSSMTEAIRKGTPWREYQQVIDKELRAFRKRRKAFLLY